LVRILTCKRALKGPTIRSKVAFAVAGFDVPVAVLAGEINRDAITLLGEGGVSLFSNLNRPLNCEETIRHTASLLENAVAQALRLFKELE